MADSALTVPLPSALRPPCADRYKFPSAYEFAEKGPRQCCKRWRRAADNLIGRRSLPLLPKTTENHR